MHILTIEQTSFFGFELYSLYWKKLWSVFVTCNILRQFLEQIQMLTTIIFLNLLFFMVAPFIFLPRYLSVAIFDLNNERFRTFNTQNMLFLTGTVNKIYWKF